MMWGKKIDNLVETRICWHLYLHFKITFEETIMDFLHSSQDTATAAQGGGFAGPGSSQPGLSVRLRLGPHIGVITPRGANKL